MSRLFRSFRTPVTVMVAAVVTVAAVAVIPASAHITRNRPGHNWKKHYRHWPLAKKDFYLKVRLNTSDGTPPNVGSNRVHWDNLIGVPDLAPDGHDHDDAYFTKGQLQDPGGINTGTNPVDWTKLKNVPADFADSTDDVAAGSLAWALTGNGGTTAGTNFLGTSDNVALELKVNGQRALRLEPDITSPSVIGGHSANAVSTAGATISGGGNASQPNTVTDNWGTVGGGRANQAGDAAPSGAIDATVGGGHDNTAGASWATVGGGDGNTAGNEEATVGGGFDNTASGNSSTIGGGETNVASGSDATVGGGSFNEASAISANVAGGSSNTANAHSSTVGGGSQNTASASSATVPGGANNTAAGLVSFAAGHRAKANHDGAFVWGDFTNVDFASTGVNQFNVRAQGDINLSHDGTFPTDNGFINTTTGGYLSAVGVWTDASSRAVKQDFAPVDGRQVLAQVTELPVTTWSYRGDGSSIRHIGPVAEDFHAMFGVGDDSRHLASLDTGGVALAAIQGLHQELEEKESRIVVLEERLSSDTEAAPSAPGGWGWAMVLALGLAGGLAGGIMGGARIAARRLAVA